MSIFHKTELFRNIVIFTVWVHLVAAFVFALAGQVETKRAAPQEKVDVSDKRD